MPSEQTPLLNGSSSGRRTNGDIERALDALPSRGDIESALPSKGERIRVAEAVGALQAGKLPSQKQLSKLINVIIESDTLKASGGQTSRTARLGPEGQRVLESTKDVLRAFKAWGEDKNGDDLLQNLFYNAATADVDVDLDNVNLPSGRLASQRELSKDAQRAIASCRTIASLLVTNPAFRSLVSDVILLARDLFADAAASVANDAATAADRARPSERERKQGVDLDKLYERGERAAKNPNTVRRDVKNDLWAEVEGVRQYLDEKLPEGEEARDQLIARIRESVKQAQSNPEYRRAITALVDMVKKYAHRVEGAVDAAKTQVEANAEVADEDAKVQQVVSDLGTFIERLSGQSLAELGKAIKAAAKDIDERETLKAYFAALDQFVDRVLYDPGYVVSQRAYKKASSLIDDAHALWDDGANAEFKAHLREAQLQLEKVGAGIANDASTTRLVDALEGLGSALSHAAKVGVNALRADGQGLYRDLVDVALPRAISLVQELPVPRIEYKSEDVDLVIDDIKLTSASFIPDSVQLTTHNDLRFTQGYATYASEYDGSIRMRVDGLHFAAKDIAFWVNSKTGFWPFEDAGLLALTFGPKGVSFDVTLENADADDDRATFYVVKNVEVQLDDFDFSISRNRQWFATWFAKPALRAFVKRNLSSALESQIANALRDADHRMYGLQQRVIATVNARTTDPTDLVRAIFSDSIFPSSSSTDRVSVSQSGVVKYGRRGEWLLHVGVADELFPDQPPADISNAQRAKIRAKAQATSQQVRRAVGAANANADEIEGQAQRAADEIEGEVRKEGEDMRFAAREQKRREERKEGWRSDAFDV